MFICSCFVMETILLLLTVKMEGFGMTQATEPAINSHLLWLFRQSVISCVQISVYVYMIDCRLMDNASLFITVV